MCGRAAVCCAAGAVAVLRPLPAVWRGPLLSPEQRRGFPAISAGCKITFRFLRVRTSPLDSRPSCFGADLRAARSDRHLAHTMRMPPGGRLNPGRTITRATSPILRRVPNLGRHLAGADRLGWEPARTTALGNLDRKGAVKRIFQTCRRPLALSFTEDYVTREKAGF
jgi:hypothetical protein